MAIYYIGSFPPDYGGVTIKNQNLAEELARTLDIRRIDMNRVKRGDIKELLRFAWAMATGRQYIIGLAGQKNRRQFTNLMYRFKRGAMKRSVLLVMSGIVEDVIQAGSAYMHSFSTYCRVYVEFPAMVRKLAEAGVTNAAVYPNARPRPAVFPPVTVGEGPLQCVYFSQIEPEKGVDRILEAAAKVPGMQFHFYGRIVPGYREIFLEGIKGRNNIHYHGVFTGTTEAVYRELSRYDVLLLPTRCKTEGLPGILIEAKIAGLPLVISGINYCRELVEAGIDGFVLEEDTPVCLAKALQTLDEDRDGLLSMKLASRESAEQYYIDACAKEILGVLQGKGTL